MSVFDGWYTDTVDIYRNKNTEDEDTGIAAQAWDKVVEGAKCRIYNSHKAGPVMSDREAKLHADDKLAMPLGSDIQSGDKLIITRGGAVGGTTVSEYYAGDVMPYYEPVGGMFNGLEHIEVGLLQEVIV
jgi:hypothetical protein